MGLFQITIDGVEEPYIVESNTPEDAIQELKDLQDSQEISGDIQEIG